MCQKYMPTVPPQKVLEHLSNTQKCLNVITSSVINSKEKYDDSKETFDKIIELGLTCSNNSSSVEDEAVVFVVSV